MLSLLIPGLAIGRTILVNLQSKVLGWSYCHWWFWLNGINTGVFVSMVFGLSLSVE